ncbi:hypothetical protein AAHE18_19G269300 [Arachis hypogaea]
MVSLESVPRSIDAPSSPRISFSAEFLDENNFISISPNPEYERDNEEKKEDFEFLSNNVSNNNNTVLTADELFFEGKLLPFWQMQHLEKLSKINLKAKEGEEEEDDDEDEELEEEVVVVTNNNNSSNNKEESSRVNWGNCVLFPTDPSPRPPKCTILWKELLRLKKQRASSSLSPSSSSSSSSSSASSLGDVAAKEGKEQGSSRNNNNNNNNNNHKEQHVKRIKKGLERTRSATIRIRPMINVPICTQVKSSALPPLFPLKKGRLER